VFVQEPHEGTAKLVCIEPRVADGLDEEVDGGAATETADGARYS
jgi:hypothetical protein